MKRIQQYVQTQWHRTIQYGALLMCIFILLSSTIGCTSTRKTMYLGSKRVGDYIAHSEGQAIRDNAELWKVRKAHLRNYPDGNRLFGGFCTDKAVKRSLKQLRALKDPCIARTTDYNEQANLQGRLFWGFLSASIVTGAGMIVGGLAPSDPAVKGWMAFSFGAATLGLAAVSGFGGFDGKQTVFQMRAKKLDNLIWTMRLRFIAEVCNAKTVHIARQQAKQIVRMTRSMCVSNYQDDGIYRIPTRRRP